MLAIKQLLVAELVQALERDLQGMRRAAQDARAAATHEEAKPENDKDTRALEASYLAGAQAARVRELEAEVVLVRTMPLRDLDGASVEPSALVTLEDEQGAATTFFLAPAGGGMLLATATELGPVQVLTPSSPRGRTLLGRSEGESIEVPAGRTGVVRELTVTRVR